MFASSLPHSTPLGAIAFYGDYCFGKQKVVLWHLLTASPEKAGEHGWEEAKEGCGEMLWKSRWAVQVHRRDQGHSLKDSQRVELD